MSISAKKSLGQHFLFDLNITRKIARLAGDLSGCTVFEIGPGPGGLTRALLETGADKIVAIEKDRRFAAELAGLAAASNGRLTVIEADALGVDLNEVATETINHPPLEGGSKSHSDFGVGSKHNDLTIVANLPYNIASPLLLSWLKNISDFKSMTLMFQSEVADRITARPGTKAYGRLSVISQFCCRTKRVMSVPARAFTPPPKVDSAVVHFTPRADRPKDIPFEAMETVTAAAFGQRRKMLRSSLKRLGGDALLAKAGIAPTRRAEELSVGEFERLALFSKN